MALPIAVPFLTISIHNNAVTVAINRFLVEGTQRRYTSRLRHVSSNLHSLYTAHVFIPYEVWHMILLRAMAQAVSGPSLCAGTRVQSQVSPCGDCGEGSVAGTGFSPRSLISVLPYQYCAPFCRHYVTLAMYCCVQQPSVPRFSFANASYIFFCFTSVKVYIITQLLFQQNALVFIKSTRYYNLYFLSLYS
jgi:hypothetical protein